MMETEKKPVSQVAVIGVLAATTLLILVISYLSNILGFLKSLFVGSPNAKAGGLQTQKVDDKGETEVVQARPQKNHSEGRSKDAAKSRFAHKWLIASLKAHTGNIQGINFSSNGKYIVSCADDRTIYLWFVKEYVSNGSKFIRVNVEFDHGTRICFSPDNKAFLVTLFSAATIRVYKMLKKDDGNIIKIAQAFDFPEKETEEVLRFGISSNGRFVMTCYKNSTLKVWDIKGVLLDTINSHQVNHTHGAISPCGRFVACSGFTPEVKVWEVSFTKTNDFKEVAKAFQLGGHSSSVYSFAFNADSTRVATVSKDGSWKLWDTNIDYKNKQDPKLIQTWSCDFLVGSSLIALSANGLSVAIANQDDLYLYNVHQSDYEKITNVHPGGVVAVEFSPNDLHLISAGQKSIYMFHNAKGLHALIDDLTLKLKSASNTAMKERIKEQISSTRCLLEKIDEPIKVAKNVKS